MEISNDHLLIGKQPKFFQSRRVAVFIFCALTDMLVFFHRAAPNVVVKEMAHSYGCSESSIALFSSIFFYPYAALQALMGPLVDVFEPGYIMTVGTLLSSVGSVICGLSNSLFVGCFGRLLVGIGSSPMYIASMRTIANWFEHKNYGIIAGIFVTIAGGGGLIAQFPLASYAEIVGWRWCFHTVAITGTVLSCIDIFVIRGNPVVCGFNHVNLDDEVNTQSIKDKFKTLYNNIKIVIKNGSFWLLALWGALVNGAYYDVNGMWGGPWLETIKKFGKKRTGVTLMGISIGNMIGGPILPVIADCVKSKKWPLVATGILLCGSILPFIFVKAEKLSQAVIFILFFLFSVFSNTATCISFPLLREYYPPSASGTAVGISNMFGIFSSVIYQPVTGRILDIFGTDENNNYTEEGFKYALWVFSLASSIVGIIPLLFIKETHVYNDENDQSLIVSTTYESITSLAEPDIVIQ